MIGAGFPDTGTIINKWLRICRTKWCRAFFVEMVHNGIEDDPGLRNIQAYVEHSGEGRRTIEELIEPAVPASVITQSVQARFRSRQDNPFSGRLPAALRKQSGGPTVKQADS
ncbi:MAG TPA: hypothetical protein G4O07_01000 [Dehalococcoidia bacterium]|nr:hypothetical protein [Dehalococcoidia bacterium]